MTPLGNTQMRPLQLDCLGQRLRDASTNRCQSSFAVLGESGSTNFLAISDQTDVGISSALPLALASSAFPMLCPLSRLAVSSARSRYAGRGWQRFRVLQCSQDDLGPLYTPAVRDSRREPSQCPNLTACLLAQALNSLLWLVPTYGAGGLDFQCALGTFEY